MGFKDVEIKNFRGIKSLEIKDLRQVNLFLGKNNCGKTSVLEALFLLSGMSNPELLLRINMFREYLINKVDDFLYMFYDQDSQNKINIKAIGDGNFSRELSIFPIKKNIKEISLKDLEEEKTLSNKAVSNEEGLIFKFVEGHKESDEKPCKITFSDNSKNGGDIVFKIEKKKDYKESIHSVYVHQRSIFSKTTIKEIIEGKEEQHIVDILQIIEPRIKNLHLVGSIVMVDVGGKKLLPINLLGDGIRKMLSIVVALYEAKDGLLLIDEIDNGLHFSTLDLVWNVIFKTAHKFNVQVMMTTHNEELIQSLDKILSTDDLKEYQKDLACYSLKRFDGDDMRAFRYDYENLSFAMEQNIEIR